MTKKMLSQVYYLQNEIKMWQRELDRIEHESLVKGQEITGMPFAKTNATSDKVADRATQVVEIKEKIRTLQRAAEDMRESIIEYIGQIEDSYTRQIFYYRHVQCMNWKRVAKMIGGGNTADSVRMAHDRYLEKEE